MDEERGCFIHGRWHHSEMGGCFEWPWMSERVLNDIAIAGLLICTSTATTTPDIVKVFLAVNWSESNH